MEYVKGYNNDAFDIKILNLETLKDTIKNLDISRIVLDGKVFFSDKKALLFSDIEVPVTYSHENIFYSKTFCINTEYYNGNKDFINDIIKMIIKNRKGRLTISDSKLITDEVIEEIALNPNINEVTLGSRDDIYYVSKEVYEKLKNTGIKEIETYGVSDELNDTFEPQLAFNMRRNIIDNWTYDSLVKLDGIVFRKELSQAEIFYLKHLKNGVKVKKIQFVSDLHELDQCKPRSTSS